MNEAEGEHDRSEHTEALGPAAETLHADIHEAERDHHIDGGRVELPPGESRGEEGDAVAEHEERDDLRRPAQRPGQEHDPDDEEEVVPARDHVQKPEPDVFANRAIGVAVPEEGMGRRNGRQQQGHH